MHMWGRSPPFCEVEWGGATYPLLSSSKEVEGGGWRGGSEVDL
jgi:hypothetical protein